MKSKSGFRFDLGGGLAPLVGLSGAALRFLECDEFGVVFELVVLKWSFVLNTGGSSSSALVTISSSWLYCLSVKVCLVALRVNRTEYG